MPFAGVAHQAQRLAVRQVVTRAAVSNCDNVVGLGLALVTADAAAVLARPRVTRENRQPPRPVRLVAVAAGSSGRPIAFVPAIRSQTQRPVRWNASWHQLLIITTAAAVALVLVATSLMYGTP